MCIQIRQIVARVSVALAARPFRWNGENGTRPFRVPSRELFVHDDAVPFFPPLPPERPALAGRAIDFPFPFLPRRNTAVFGAGLRVTELMRIERPVYRNDTRVTVAYGGRCNRDGWIGARYICV